MGSPKGTGAFDKWEPRKVPLFWEGEMLEWLKRHAWKACKRQKRFLGSNPCLSAIGRLASHAHYIFLYNNFK